MICRICNNDQENTMYTGREMYFGHRDEFEYFQCAMCGCLQIARIPDNMAKYYPKEYTAYKLHERIHDSKTILYLKRKKLENSLGINLNPLGVILNLFITKGFINYLHPANIRVDSSILDVGTGHGSRLISLRKKGFTNLTGIDPFIDQDIEYETGVKIYKKYLSEAEGQYDLVMLNHSFEHMPDPLQAMKDIYRLLKPDRTALIRIPVADSYGWRKYGVNWMAMDPPRHFYLHTRKSISILAEKTGFTIFRVFCDSIALHIAASEEFSKDIPLISPHSYYSNPKKSIFSRKQIRTFKRIAKEANKNDEGDTACFYLVKKQVT
jgi:SAM-dependent methyltransferase